MDAEPPDDPHVEAAEESATADHPCYGDGTHKEFGRIHLPVAPDCNVSCGYCDRRFDCPNENRPGVSSDVLSPEEAVDRVGEILDEEPRITVAGFAGPGDSLANEETFETLELLNERHPQLKGCISTNGLLLPDRIDRLDRLGVETVTVTVNAVDPAIGEEIYGGVTYDGTVYQGAEAFQLLLFQQLRGIRTAVDRGMVVKVNSILIPGVNEDHLPAVAETAADLGAYVHNVTPLIPMAEFAEHESPDHQQVAAVREACGGHLNQFRNCQQCRADAAGMLADDRSLASVNVSGGQP
ncbi:radical SAM protein [Halorhabdus sp. BNX81]|uniref:radical SAM protein n=1 Tax=Halorhabdus sp. BNX81 TaxID=2980181 RepID=UPI0023DD5FA7|nr:radical SAM protein [Halorhabdus sp. BNX81]WEL20651.1 Nitrogenase cofactor biosynthesis protein NifB [Halorhabdus sp. BNX81]